MTDQDEFANTGGQYTNSASGNARVGAQFGVVHGDVNYGASSSDDPEKKFAVAKECLEAGMHRPAEDLIHAAIESGLRISPEVAYYWTLATLSDRSFEELEEKHFSRLSTAFAVGNEASADEEWATALGVIKRLIQCLIAQDKRRAPDPIEFENVVADFQLLTAGRLDEFRRHLLRIMAGAMQDQLDAFDAAEVRKLRMSDGRKGRAWKFFQAKPTPPLATPIGPSEIGVVTWIRLVCGLAMGSPGLYLAVPAGMGLDASTAIFGLVLIAAGGLAAVRFDFRRVALRSRLRAAERDYEPPPDPDPVADPVTGELEKPSKFATDIGLWIKIIFELRGPRDPDRRSAWRADTEGIRKALTHRIAQTYEYEAVSAESLAYLVNHYANEAARAWTDKRLLDYRGRWRVPARVVVGLVAGLVALCGGTFVWSALLVSHGLWFTTLLAVVGAWHIGVAGVRIYRDRERRDAEQERSDNLFAEEWATYDRWRGILADKPSDAEIARWLDYDKMHLRLNAMKQYALTSRDVIAYAVLLTEDEGGSWRARVLNGPPRYSWYRVTVYLLTDGGVHQVETKLDFYTGDTHDESRMTFRYDAISEVKVTEERPYVLVLTDENTIEWLAEDELMVRKGFSLAFVSGNTFNVLIESFSGDFADRDTEDRDRLQEIAFDTSGISGALSILEAVAAEGRRWIDNERARRKRRIRDFESTNGHRRGDTTATLSVLTNSVPNPVP